MNKQKEKLPKNPLQTFCLSVAIVVLAWADFRYTPMASARTLIFRLILHLGLNLGLCTFNLVYIDLYNRYASVGELPNPMLLSPIALKKWHVIAFFVLMSIAVVYLSWIVGSQYF